MPSRTRTPKKPDIFSRIAAAKSPRAGASADEAFKESVARYRTAVQIIRDAIVSVDGRGRIIFFNPTAEAIFGYRVEEIIGHPYRLLIPPHDRRRKGHPILRIFRSRRVARPTAPVEITGRTKDGRDFPMEVSVSAVRTAKGLSFITVIRDVSERRAMADALAESGEAFRALTEVSGNGIFIVQGDRITYANPAALSIMRSTLEELGRVSIFDTIYADDRAGEEARVRARFTGHGDSQAHEIRVLRNDGAVRWVRTSSSVATIRGTPSLIVTFTDITDTRAAADLLREGEERFRALIEHSPLGIMYAGTDGQIQVVNRALLEILGSPSAEATRQINLLTFPPLVQSGAADAFRACLNEDRAHIVEVPYHSKWGKQIFARLIASPMHDAAGAVTGLQVMVEDITSQRRAQDAVAAAETRYRAFVDQSSEAIWRFELGEPIPVDLPVEEQIDRVFAHAYLAERNDAMARMYGLSSAQDLVNVRLGDLLDPGDPHNREYLRGAARNGYRVVNEESHEYDVSGHLKYFLNNFVGMVEGGALVRGWGTQRDVTDQKRMEQALRESETKFRSLVERSLAGIYIIQDDRFAYVNPRMAETFGYAPEEMLALETIFPIIDPADHLLVAENVRLRTDGATEGVRYAFRGIRRDGTPIDVEVHGARTEYGGRPAIIGTLLDVTERTRTENALRDSERRLADLIDFLPDAMFAIDLEGRVIAWNRAVETLTGVHAQEILGKGNFEVGLPFYGVRRPVLAHLALDPDFADLERRYPFVTRERDTLVTEVYVPFPGYKKEGVWLWGRAAPLFDAHGKVTGAIEVVRDVTARKHAEEALRVNEERYRTLAESSQDLIYIIDLNGRIQFTNAAGEAAIGRSRGEIAGRLVTELFPFEPGTELPNLRRVLETGTPHRHEALVNFPRGAVWLDTQLIPLKDDRGAVTGVFGISRDSTERKRAEEALRSSEERYRALAESSQDFIFLIGRDGTVEYANPCSAREFVGGSAALVGRSVSDCFPGDAGRMGESLRGVFENGEPAYLENLTQFPTRALWLDTWLIPLRDAQGAVRSVFGISRDFTRRKEAEDQLRNTTAELQAIFQANPDLYFRTAADGTILDYKAGKTEDLYVPPEQFLGKRMQDVLPPDIGILLRDAQKRLAAGGGIQVLEYALPMPGGSEHYEGRLVPLREGEAVVFVRNITDRKRAEEALISKERYQALFERSLDCVFIHDFEGRFLDANNAMLATLGYAGRELLTTEFTALLDPAQVEAAREAFQEIQRTGSQRSFIEYRLRRKDGSTVYLETKGSVVYRDGKPWAIQGLARNITKRKRAEQQLQESERLYRELYEKYRNIIESTPDAITVSDLEGTIVECNQPALDMHGAAAKEEIIGRNAFDLIAPRDIPRAQEGMLATLSTGALRNLEYTVVRKNGSEFPAEMSVSLVRDASGRPVSFVAIIKDITERKRLEQQAIQSEKMAAVGTLVAGLSHELNNPIGVILGYAQSLLKRAPADSPMRGALQSVEREAQRCANLVRVLLDFSRKSPAPRVRSSVAAIARRVAEIAGEQAVRRRITLTLDPIDERAPGVLINVTEVESAIFNLLTNAMDATPAGGAVRLAVECGARDGIGGVEVGVADTGSGIPPDEVGKIFEPFFTTKPVGKGTGLGLSLTRQIVESHGGRIAVDTAVGRGTTMTIWLPAAPPAE